MWNRQGDCCYERNMKDENGPIAAAIFRGIQIGRVSECSKKPFCIPEQEVHELTCNLQKYPPVNVFIYIPSLVDNVNKGETDYFVHIVILNKERSKTVEYRIKDWSGIFDSAKIKSGETKYNIGITGQGVLIISCEETLYYLCLETSWAEQSSLRGRQIPRNSKLDFWVHDIPKDNFGHKGYGSKCVSELGLKIENIYEQYNSSQEADKLICIVSRCTVSDRAARQTTHQSFFEFLDLEWDDDLKVLNFRSDTKIVQKRIDIEEQQLRCSDARN
jgi:hypothetical protein